MKTIKNLRSEVIAANKANCPSHSIFLIPGADSISIISHSSTTESCAYAAEGEIYCGKINSRRLTLKAVQSLVEAAI